MKFSKIKKLKTGHIVCFLHLFCGFPTSSTFARRTIRAKRRSLGFCIYRIRKIEKWEKHNNSLKQILMTSSCDGRGHDPSFAGLLTLLASFVRHVWHPRGCTGLIYTDRPFLWGSTSMLPHDNAFPPLTPHTFAFSCHALNFSPPLKPLGIFADVI